MDRTRSRDAQPDEISGFETLAIDANLNRFCLQSLAVVDVTNVRVVLATKDV